ncbi:hypothetical protein MC885_021362 [Smutsia gigantea]|nr:hypothetical protein MC885_021362 [Smutsia gigantea]
MKLDKLVSDLEGIAKELDANTLKDASDLLSSCDLMPGSLTLGQ